MLSLSHISKWFGAQPAVDDVSLEVRAGQIVAVVGENGAGKTTLMRIAARELTADSGVVTADGSVELVHQHFMLVPQMTIAENLALVDSTAFRFATRRQLEREAIAMIEASGIALSGVERHVETLSVGEQSKLELIKALARNPATLILDEPTAVLTPSETDELFAAMRRIASGGTGIVFISHKLAEVVKVADRVVVMRHGRVVAETEARATTVNALAEAMFGGTPPSAAKPSRAALPQDAEVAFRYDNLEVRRSEIVAVAGVAGNGQTALAARLRERLRGAGHIPEDRTRVGIIAQMSIAENLALKSSRWSADHASAEAERVIEQYAIRASGAAQAAGSLSGGNQQKVILARELERHPSIIIAAEPTRGLDLEAASFVRSRLRDAAAGGAAVLLITSDLDEAYEIANAVHVIYRGTLSERLSRDEAPRRVPSLMAGIDGAA